MTSIFQQERPCLTIRIAFLLELTILQDLPRHEDRSQVNSILISKHANSLYSLIVDGVYRPTSLGRNKWKKLIGQQASLQTNCNQEGHGFSSVTSSSRARIGILSNKEYDCNSCDSRIGFGTAGRHPDD